MEKQTKIEIESDEFVFYLFKIFLKYNTLESFVRNCTYVGYKIFFIKKGALVRLKLFLWLIEQQFCQTNGYIDGHFFEKISWGKKFHLKSRGNCVTHHYQVSYEISVLTR